MRKLDLFGNYVSSLLHDKTGLSRLLFDSTKNCLFTQRMIKVFSMIYQFPQESYIFTALLFVGGKQNSLKHFPYIIHLTKTCDRSIEIVFLPNNP